MFVCLFIYSFVFCFNHHRIPKGSFPQNFVKIRLDLAEILRISKLDWRDRGGEEGRRRGELGGNWLGELDKLGEVKPMSDLKS